MKKSLILLSLIFSLASTVKAETPDSFIEVYNENLKDLKKDASDWDSSSNLGVKTEVNLPNYGLSFGADIKAEHLEHFILNDREYLEDNILKPSKAWIKYELPKLYDTSAYIKTFYDNYDYFLEKNYEGTYNKISIEADASHKIKDKLNIGLNSTIEFHINNNHIHKEDIVYSKHKVYVKGDYSIIKDIDAELGLSHNWHSGGLRNVFLNISASYKELKDIKLTGKIKLRHAFGNDDNLEYVLPQYRIARDLFGSFRKRNVLIHQKSSIPDICSFDLIGTYTGLKDTEIIINPFIEHSFYDDGTILTYGINAEAKYTGINNLVLSSKNSFIETNHNYSGVELKLGFIKLNANAEYTYNLNDKLTFKPSLDLTNVVFIQRGEIYGELNISPKIIVEYNPIKNLTISGSLSPILVFDKGDNQFSSNNDKFNYRYSIIKSGVNIKYAW